MTLLDKLVQFLGDAGLKLNAEKTVLITTQAQPPPFLTTSTGAVIKVKEKEAGHKWLGCMLSAASSNNAILDIDYHSESASRAFFANKWIFFSRNLSIRNKLKFFNAIVTPIACFGAGPRCIHNADMAKNDINFRRVIRSVVGAPDGICSEDPWHEILHIWNQRVRKSWEHITWKHGQKLALLNTGNLPAISRIFLTNVGHGGCYIGNLLEEDPWDVQQ